MARWPSLSMSLPGSLSLAFFTISVSYKLAWTAISSLLSQLADSYGPTVLLQLNLAYFFPSIPVLVLQTWLNERMDRWLGVPTAALLRLSLGLGGLVLLTATFPILVTSRASLLSVTVLVGVSYGLAFGSSYQLAAKFPPGCTVALTTGFVSCGLVILAFDLAIKSGPFYSPQQLKLLFFCVAMTIAGGWLAAVWLVLSNWRTLSLMQPHKVHVQLPWAPRREGGADASSWGTSNGEGNHRGMVSFATERGSKLARFKLDNGTDRATSLQGPFLPQASPLLSNHHLSDANSNGNALMATRRMSGGGEQSHAHTSYSYSQPHAWQNGSQKGGINSVYSSGSGTAGSANTQHTGGVYSASHAIDVHSLEAGMGSSNHSYSHVNHQHQMSSWPEDDSKLAKRELPLRSLLWRISPAGAAIFLSVGTSMLVFPFFTYMHSTGLLGAWLPQVLFYVRLGGDILGRLAPQRLQAQTVPRLLAWSSVKCALTPMLFASIFAPSLLLGDLGAVLLVLVFWLLSGYLNTCAYLVVHALVPPSQKGRASGLMTVVFQSACFIALLVAAALQAMLFKAVPPAAPLQHTVMRSQTVKLMDVTMDTALS